MMAALRSAATAWLDRGVGPDLVDEPASGADTRQQRRVREADRCAGRP